jgi:hypothetical protein
MFDKKRTKHNNNSLNIFCNTNTMKDIEEIESYNNNKLFIDNYIDNDIVKEFENKYKISYYLKL